MARLMFVLGNHEPTRGVLQTLELATAACAAGGEVVLYLHGDAAYLVDPERFMRIDKPYQGFESPLGMVRQALAVGVQFWFASRALDYLARSKLPKAPLSFPPTSSPRYGRTSIRSSRSRSRRCAPTVAPD